MRVGCQDAAIYTQRSTSLRKLVALGANPCILFARTRRSLHPRSTTLRKLRTQEFTPQGAPVYTQVMANSCVLGARQKFTPQGARVYVNSCPSRCKPPASWVPGRSFLHPRITSSRKLVLSGCKHPKGHEFKDTPSSTSKLVPLGV